MQALVYGNEKEVGEGLKEAFDAGIKVCIQRLLGHEGEGLTVE